MASVGLGERYLCYNPHMTNWRTTASAIATAAFGFVLFSPQYFPNWMVDLAKYATLGGLMALGITAKDSKVHSTEGEVKVATAEKARELIDSSK